MPDFALVPEHAWPEVALDSLRKPYPFPRNRKTELVSLRKALDRLVQGERDGKVMASDEAVTFLRSRIEAAARELAGREKSFTPHLTTYLNQSRYLRGDTQPEPALQVVSEAMQIVAAYPWRTAMPKNRDHLAPLLRLVNQSIEELRATHGAQAAAWILARTKRFAHIIRTWPEEELQFVPGPLRFFEEQRWKQDERLWHRNTRTSYQAERAQLSRIIM